MKNIKNHINEFHRYYEEKRVWEKNSWMGIPCWKLPLDAFVVQELILKTRPDFIIETGTGHGGSAMFYASVCELLGNGRIITIDIDETKRNQHDWGKFEWEDRIKFITGSSLDDVVFNEVTEITGINSNCMVILDSWHSESHVYKEMLLYNKFVKRGGYMIVEDSHVAGNPVPWKYNDKGPMEAINRWIDLFGNNWEIDRECEKHMMSFNPSGFIRRK